jgi:hypothetical protein
MSGFGNFFTLTVALLLCVSTHAEAESGPYQERCPDKIVKLVSQYLRANNG